MVISFAVNVPESHPTSDSVSAYLKQARLFFKANNIKTPREWQQLECHWREDVCVSMNLLPVTANQKSWDETSTVKVLKSDFKLKPLIIADRTVV